MVQEIERAAGAAELFAARDRAGLGRKAVDGNALLAEIGGGLGLVVSVAAVEPAVDLRELVVQVADLEVAPERVSSRRGSP